MSWFKRILSVVDKPKKAVVRSERAEELRWKDAGRELASAGVIAPDEPLVTDGREVYENVEGQLFLILNDEAQAVESGEPLCVNFHLGLVHPRTGEYMEFGLPTDTMAVSDLGGFVDVSLGYGSSPRDIAEALVKAEPQFLGVDFLASAPHAMNFVYNLRIGKPANIKPKEFSEAASKLISQNLKAWSVDCVFDVVEHEVTYGTDEGLSLESDARCFKGWCGVQFKGGVWNAVFFVGDPHAGTTGFCVGSGTGGYESCGSSDEATAYQYFDSVPVGAGFTGGLVYQHRISDRVIQDSEGTYWAQVLYSASR